MTMRILVMDENTQWMNLLRRALELQGLKVTHVQNVTDVGHLSSEEAKTTEKTNSKKAQKNTGKPFGKLPSILLMIFIKQWTH
jgi:cysteinyl-tRNA synthetase